MRTFRSSAIALIALFILSGCFNYPKPGPADTAGLINAGDPRACYTPDVRRLISKAVLANVGSIITTDLRNVSTSSVTRGMGVSCSADLYFMRRDKRQAYKVAVSYEVRVLLDQPGEVTVFGDFSGARKEAELLGGTSAGTP